MAVFVAIFLTIWIGLWLAGGLMFPHLHFPADIGGFIGFFGGFLVASLITGVGSDRTWFCRKK